MKKKQLGLVGREPVVVRSYNISLPEKYARRVDWFCALMGVGPSEFFRMVIDATEELVKENNGIQKEVTP